MVETTILHSPTLESVIMVEKAVQKHSQECGKYQLWKKLPKKRCTKHFKQYWITWRILERQSLIKMAVLFGHTTQK